MKLNKVLRSAAALSLALALALPLAACSGKESPDDGELVVGVLQYANHPSLDNCYEGIIQAFDEAGFGQGDLPQLDILFQNANGIPSDGDMMAKTLASNHCDLLIGIATPAAMSCYSAARDSGTPVIFCAASDPISAGLAKTVDNPQTGASGTKDALNLEGQMALIRAMLPEADTIGILYTTSEPNSVSHLADFQTLAPKYGFTIEAVGITNESEVAAGAAALVAKGVDCVNNFTDNNVVNNLSTLLHATDEAGIPVFGSEEEQVRNGCVAAESLDYVALGKVTGEMAVSVLKGEADIQTLPVSVVAQTNPVYSQSSCGKFGIQLPQEYADAANLD